MTLYTVGHWIHSQERFTELLQQHRVAGIVDVRSFPGSRKSPQFNSDIMPQWLADSHIDYLHVRALGGRRNKAPDRIPEDQWWTVTGFCNYSGYVRTPEYRNAFSALLSLSGELDVAIMCGEPSHTRCHRRMISDLATVEGREVRHIESSGEIKVHQASGWTQQDDFYEKIWVPLS